MNNDQVSVIIPVYNSEKFLEKSLESVFNQSYKNIQIIAINDGSTDGSADILKKFENKITVISQKNEGLAVALGSGIKTMKGRWFKWLSPDDILYKNAIQTLVNEAKKLPENTILYSNWDIIDENDHNLRSFLESNYNQLSSFEFNVRLLDGQQVNVNTTLIPSVLFQKGCLFRNLDDPVAIDYDFFLRAGILFETNFHLVDKSFLGYRIHKHQISHKNITKTLSYLQEIKDGILQELESSKKDEYISELHEYVKKKPLSQKTMELGLRVTNIFPDWLTDPLIIFYLNKIRRTRN